MTDLTSDHTSNDLLYALSIVYRESGDRYVMTYLNLRSYLKCHHLLHALILDYRESGDRYVMTYLNLRSYLKCHHLKNVLPYVTDDR